MSFIKSARIFLRHSRRFLAGFISIQSLAFKNKKLRFMEVDFALQEDKLQVASDLRLANFKLRKTNQNERQ
jgi:hypothetical protein